MNKLKYIKGDVLDPKHKFHAILHCANCQNTMGSGIAKSIREKYPKVYDADTFAAKQGLNVLGNISFYKTDIGFIVNMYGQNFYGVGIRQLNYEAIYSALEKVIATLLEVDKVSLEDRPIRIGIPYKMGCDRAGGEWSIVEAMIKHVFNYDIFEVTIVEWDGN